MIRITTDEQRIVDEKEEKEFLRVALINRKPIEASEMRPL